MKLHLRLRACRYSRARTRIVDAEHIAWAEALIGRRGRTEILR